MNCPKCSEQELSSQGLRGIELDRCSQCQGVWFDEAELGRLIDDQAVGGRSLGGRDSGLDRHPGQCPRDGTALLRVYSKWNRSVVLDRCPECRGVWLDGGEFQRLNP